MVALTSTRWVLVLTRTRRVRVSVLSSEVLPEKVPFRVTVKLEAVTLLKSRVTEWSSWPWLLGEAPTKST